MSTVDPLHDQKPYHWMIVLDGLGGYSGTCDWGPEESRYDRYLAVRSRVLAELGSQDGPVPPTLFFDIQPNALPATP